MSALDAVRLTSFGLGEFEKNPLRNYSSDDDLILNFKEQGVMSIGADLSSNERSSGFYLKEKDATTFVLICKRKSVFFGAFSKEFNAIEEIFPCEKMIIKNSRGIFSGVSRIFDSSGRVFFYKYKIKRIAEFFVDPMLKENLDIFKYISLQQASGFGEFLNLFEKND